MHYSELAATYEELEAVSSKLKKAEIIAKVLNSAPARLLPKVVLLLSGQVFPLWSPLEIGIANQMAIRAIAKATGVDEKKVAENFKKTGDLGICIEELVTAKKQTTLKKKVLSVEDVFENLQKLAEQTGAGSQEKKINLIVELLSHATPKEARYIIRTLLGQLRVGVAEGIVRDAIASAFKVDVDRLESAWFVRPDYGDIAKLVAEHGEKGLEKIKLELGVPLMVQLAEKSPDLKSALEAFKRAVCEYKYDGARIVVHKKRERIWLYTRRLEDVTNAFPDITSACKRGLHAKDCIVEGEAIAVNPRTGKPLPFQRLSQRIKRKYEIAAVMKEIPVNFHLFDMIHLGGRDLFDKNLEERFEILKKTVKPIKGKLEFAHRLVTTDLKRAEKFYKQALADGQEGLIVKNLDAKYTPGRRVAGGWLKVKPTMENLDLVIVGGVWGMGKRGGFLGSLILGARDPDTGKFLECGMLGSGVKEKKQEEGVTLEELTKMLKPLVVSEQGGVVKVKPKVVIEVAYEEIQKSPTYTSGFALRFPRLIRMREDKGPEEADTLTRIKALFEIQKGRAPSEP